ncbi:MAG: hypothetical protein IJ196_04295 [Prevotella sp.]|nr:hypothetical protein [Prevotella sp.]
MKLTQLLQAYEFDELMPVINEMFLGTNKFRKQLREAYDIAVGMRPVASKKSIRYRIIDIPGSDHKYIGAADSDFQTSWEVCLGKEVVREKGADLSDLELAANCLVNMCLTSNCPRMFEESRQVLLQG